MEYKKLQNNFERELIVRIVTSLRKKTLSEARAKQIAADFLPTLQKENIDGFSEELVKLGRKYTEIMEAFITTFTEYEKYTVTTNLQRIRTEFKNGGNA